MKKNISLPTFAIVLMSGLLSCDGNRNTTDNMSTDTSVTATTIPTNVTAEKTDNMTSNPDQKLVYELIESMYAGVALMKDGEQKATNPAVKALATKLVTEHSKLTAELETLSKAKGWPLPTGEPVADMENREKMGKKSVEEFQKDWLAALRERHETNIGKLENANPTDADVKMAGEKGLPKIKALLGDIKNVQASVK